MLHCYCFHEFEPCHDIYYYAIVWRNVEWAEVLSFTNCMWLQADLCVCSNTVVIAESRGLTWLLSGLLYHCVYS